MTSSVLRALSASVAIAPSRSPIPWFRAGVYGGGGSGDSADTVR
jgi:hypothetical protein